MLYFTIPAENAEAENKWIIENLDHGAGDSFVVNKEDEAGNQFCVISIPDDGKSYTTTMKEHFADYIDVAPMGEEPKPVMETKLVKGKLVQVQSDKISRANLQDIE